MAYDRGFNSITIMHVDAKQIFWFGAVPFHIAIFSSPIICQQAHMCEKIKIIKTLDKKVWAG